MWVLYIFSHNSLEEREQANFPKCLTTPLRIAIAAISNVKNESSILKNKTC